MYGDKQKVNCATRFPAAPQTTDSSNYRHNVKKITRTKSLKRVIRKHALGSSRNDLHQLLRACQHP
jgi:hypothetical protein